MLLSFLDIYLALYGIHARKDLIMYRIGHIIDLIPTKIQLIPHFERKINGRLQFLCEIESEIVIGVNY